MKFLVFSICNHEIHKRHEKVSCPVPCPLFPVPYAAQRGCAAFSLMEMLFAVCILGLGLIMVAGIFPIAIKWTAENTQSSVGAVVAANAFATINSNVQYFQATHQSPDETPFNLYYQTCQWGSQPYAFGTNQPDAPASGTQPQYFWTTYLQLLAAPNSTGIQAISTSSLYRVYIFVFAKADPNDTYTTQTGGMGLEQQPSVSSQVPLSTPYPQIYAGTFANVRADAGSASPMPIGSLGLDLNTGTVFRQIISTGGAIATIPPVNNSDDVLYAPAATGNGGISATQTDSPLIYIYTGTVSF